MKNKDKLQKNFSKYNDLMRQLEECRQACNTESGRYFFSCHLHSKNPAFSVWDISLGSMEAAEFEIEESGVLVVDKGRYSDEEAQEMKKIIEDWLSKDA